MGNEGRPSAVEVATSYGRVKGTEAGAVRAFRGIPFAAPPVGPLRFAAPVPPAPWDGVRDATRSGPACPQSTGGRPGQEGNTFSGLFGPGDLAMDEDCLNLNVFAPASATPESPKPVMVWIHGGAFRLGTGSAPMYDGSALARRGDVVVVSINYRLGVLGFLNLAEVGPPNVGLLDQLAALRWVHDEIASFGGDPDNVTIFGESAGGKSVECLVASPHSQGLFRRAIAQSTYHTSLDLEPAREAAEKLLAALGVAGAGGKIDRSRLESVAVDDLLGEMSRQTMANMAAGGGLLGALGGWTPVIDGDVLTARPQDAFAAGEADDVAMIIGTTRDEAALFTAMMPMLSTMEDAALPGMLGMLLGTSDTAETLIDAYRRSRGSSLAAADVLVAAMTDRMFRQHSLRLAEAKAGSNPDTWMYLFDWRGVGMDGALGACHALEIPFVFRTLDSDLGRLAGAGPDAESLSDAMIDAWASFARGGDPSTSALDWPRYDTSRRATAAFGPIREIRDAPLDVEREAWVAIGS